MAIPVTAGIGWGALANAAPVIVEAAMRLYQRLVRKAPVEAGPASPAALNAKIEALERDAAEQSKIVADLAGQVESLTRATASLRARLALVSGLAATAFLLSAAVILLRHLF